MAYSVSNMRATHIADRMRAALRNFGEEMVRRRVYRTTLMELNALSNRELADLGMNRSELRRVAYEAAYGS